MRISTCALHHHHCQITIMPHSSNTSCTISTHISERPHTVSNRTCEFTPQILLSQVRSFRRPRITISQLQSMTTTSRNYVRQLIAIATTCRSHQRSRNYALYPLNSCAIALTFKLRTNTRNRCAKATLAHLRSTFNLQRRHITAETSEWPARIRTPQLVRLTSTLLHIITYTREHTQDAHVGRIHAHTTPSLRSSLSQVRTGDEQWSRFEPRT